MPWRAPAAPTRPGWLGWSARHCAMPWFASTPKGSPACATVRSPADQHAVMVLDQAGWHRAKALNVPDTVTLVLLPPYSPELNPVERVWLYLRERFFSHRVLDGYDAIVTACCKAWNALTPERLRSLTRQPWVQKVTP